MNTTLAALNTECLTTGAFVSTIASHGSLLSRRLTKAEFHDGQRESYGQ
jgi:hypothetical protein